jgi:hypothetical protein
MKRLLLLSIIVLSVLSPAWAESPTDVVKKVYAGWQAIRPCYSSEELKFFRSNKASFDPSLYQDLVKAYELEDPMWPGSDLLFGGQVDVYGYSVQTEKIDGTKATVDIFVRLGLSRSRSEVYGYQVHLVQSAVGWQISDLDKGDYTLNESLKAYLEFQQKSKP